MSELTTERLEKRIKNCIEVGNGCVMLPVSVAEELLAYRKTVNHLLDNDGSRGKFSAVQSYDAREDLERLLAVAQQNELQNIPAQPVIPEQPEPTISFYRDGIIAAAKWVENQRDAYDNEHGQSDPDTGAFEFGNDAQLEYSTTLSEIAEGIRSLHPASAQPVIPEQIEPAAWRCDKEGTKGVVITVHKQVADSWILKGWKVTPLKHKNRRGRNRHCAAPFGRIRGARSRNALLPVCGESLQTWAAQEQK